MDTYTVKPVFYKKEQTPDNPGRSFDLTVSVPGSKSITARALMLAALSDGKSRLTGIQLSDDSRHFLSCLKDLGFKTDLDEQGHAVTITGHGGKIPVHEASINVGSAGTAARFLTAMLGCAPGIWHIDASEQMRKRPMAPLLDTLTQLGCRVVYEGAPGHFPFTLISNVISEDTVTVDITDSSQFLSALLMSAVMLPQGFTVRVNGTHGLSYINMTVRMMEQFGVKVTSQGSASYFIPAGTGYSARLYEVEPDVSAAAYFYAMAAISGGTATVYGVHEDSMQGDIAFTKLLTEMGCTSKDSLQGIRITGPRASVSRAGGSYPLLKGIDIDMSSFSDQVLTLAAIAPFADSPTRIRNIGHIRYQECDRMEAVLTDLHLMGIRAYIEGNDIIIYPGDPGPALIETYGDHRVAMSFALTGMRAPGIIIKDPLCCRKTFENYFDILDRITPYGLADPEQ